MPSHRPLRHYRRYPRRSRTPRALRWFAAVVLLLLLLLPLFAGCASQSAETERGTAHSEAAFTLPDIPPLLVTSEARASYLAAYYWQGFNFRDTALISRPEVTEQALADFLDILSRVPLGEAQSSLTAMMDSAAVDSAMYAHFIVGEIPLRAQLAFPQRGVLHPCAAPRHCFAPSGRTGQGTR